jgi:acyl dehydratase
MAHHERHKVVAIMTEITLANVKDFVGHSLGASDWIDVDQSKINQFAECTGDRQWIHVDVERAKRESPFGGTIAHGYLSLSLVAALAMNMGLAPVDASAVINYGLDKVRFITPVKAGERVRLQLSLVSIEPKENGQFLIRSKSTLEIENGQAPALVAEGLALIIP